MKTIGDRMKYARERLGISQKDVSTLSGVKQPMISRLERNEAWRTSSVLALARALKVNPDWLQSGRGEMEGNQVCEIIPTPYRSPDTLAVPAFDARPSMGHGGLRPDHDTIMGALPVSREWARRNLTVTALENLAVLTAYGDSMAPTFADGDVLLVDRGVREVSIDAVFVLALNNELYVKRVQRRITDGALIIRSDNQHYEPVTLDNGERCTLEVLGRVVWAWRGKRL